MKAWKGLSGLLLVGIMIAAPYIGEYAKNHIEPFMLHTSLTVPSAAASAAASEPSGLNRAGTSPHSPARAGFGGALGPTPARACGEGARSDDATLAHGIKAYGEPWFCKKVEQALDLLEKKDPEGYELVVNHVREVRADETIDLGIFAKVNVSTGTVYYRPSKNQTPVDVAPTLVHEATHIWLYEQGMPYFGEEAEEIAAENNSRTAYLLTMK